MVSFGGFASLHLSVSSLASGVMDGWCQGDRLCGGECILVWMGVHGLSIC